jgi:hypothetical protein
MMQMISEPTFEGYSPTIKTILADWWAALANETDLSPELLQLARDVVYPTSEDQFVDASQKPCAPPPISHL